MSAFSWIFVIFLLAGTACRLWLSNRQTRNVRAHRSQVPEPFAQKVSLEDHQKAADYTHAKAQLGRMETLYDAMLLLGWTLGGGIALVQSLVQGSGLGGLWGAIASILLVLLVSSALSLPFSIAHTFGIEARFGFNRSTPGLFVADMLKGLALTLVLGVPLIAAVLWIMAHAGELWWLYAWALWSGFGLLMFWAYPTLIAPLFNKFEPLEDASLKQRVETLLERCGFHSKGIFVMDGSRRSAHGNAYFTGIGNNKRIVFFDTLIKTLEPLEVEAVLAHELGHFRKRHVRKRIIWSLLSSLIGLALLGWLKTQLWFYTGLGVPAASDQAALLLFIMIAPVFTYFFSPLSAWFSRKHEFEADAYAASQSDAGALAEALVKLYRENASTLTPDPVHSAFYDSHPPALTRIQHLNGLANSA
ncbi:MAG: M48 family metallopeptidase [Gammaproteobacteria bacterium]|jgi:STE24 endopeptidase|nr:M48 family metallopeptidase [Gammaproteobacteria bacterium]